MKVLYGPQTPLPAKLLPFFLLNIFCWCCCLCRQQVKKFLMDAKLPDPRPLIHVCDRHDFIEEMTGYLYNNNMQKYIEVFMHAI